MTRAIVHRTPGLLDVRSITVAGLSAKPNSTNPIGQFGTGLKYSISTLVRLGATLRIYIGLVEYEFTTKRGEFRGQDYGALVMKRRKPGLLRANTIELPFTTNYGKFWEPWMVFRELHSNTLDEGGATFAALQVSEAVWELDPGADDHATLISPSSGHTTIVVELDAYAEAFDKRDEVFHPDGIRVQDAGQAVQILPAGEEPLIYYRVLRVWKAPKPTLRTYNLLAQTPLTEDRTLSGDWYARYYLAQAVAQSDDAELIEDVLCAEEDVWEHNLEFQAGVRPSDTFIEVSRRCQAKLGRSAYGYYSAHAPTGERALTPWEQYARPWSVDESRVLDRHGDEVTCRPAAMEERVWAVLASNLCASINKHAPSGADPNEVPF